MVRLSESSDLHTTKEAVGDTLIYGDTTKYYSAFCCVVFSSISIGVFYCGRGRGLLLLLLYDHDIIIVAMI